MPRDPLSASNIKVSPSMAPAPLPTNNLSPSPSHPLFPSSCRQSEFRGLPPPLEVWGDGLARRQGNVFIIGNEQHGAL